MILGQVKSTESCKIIIQITHGFNTLLDVHYINEVDDLTGDVVQGTNKRLFDIQFQTNRTPFLLQHNALRWMQEHNLFSILNANPKYVDSSSSTVFVLDKSR